MNYQYQTLLMNEPPLVIRPKMATIFGLSEAIIIQQLHYWLERTTHVKDNRRWIYNTYKEWAEQFPFWSDKTIRRIIKKLEDDEIVVSTSDYNKMKFDNTKWYRLNYQRIEEIILEYMNISPSDDSGTPSGQSDQTTWSDCPHPSGQIDQANNQRLHRDYNKENSSSSSEEFKTVFETQKIMQFWDQNGFGFNNMFAKGELLKYLDEGYGSDMLIKALEIAAENDKRNINFVRGIFREWQKSEVRTVEQADAHAIERRNKKELPYKRQPKKNDVEPKFKPVPDERPLTPEEIAEIDQINRELGLIDT